MDEKTIYCNVRHITYQNEENGFVIFAAEKDFQRFSAKGYLPSVDPGQHLKLTGTWEDDPRYGKQFKFSSAEVVLPTDARGIQKYLSRGIIKGIGPATALNIIKAFGKFGYQASKKAAEQKAECDKKECAQKKECCKDKKECGDKKECCGKCEGADKKCEKKCEGADKKCEKKCEGADKKCEKKCEGEEHKCEKKCEGAADKKCDKKCE